jgi:hypothetical protein
VNAGSLLDDNDDELFTFFSKPVDVEYDPDYWIASNESVPILPSFYHVLPSSVPIENGQANLIAERIKQVLRDRSIVATYHSLGAKADCTTKYHVRFRIRFYRGKVPDVDTIIVEVQRLEGFEVMFQKDVMAIFDAAEGKPADPLLDEVDPTYDDFDDDYDDIYTQNSLALVNRILFPGDETLVDATRRKFAISALLSMTNARKVGRSATDLSMAFLVSENCARIRDFIVANVCSLDNEQASPNQYDRVNYQSLEILTNVTSCLQRDSEETNKLPLIQSLLPHLIKLIENAASDPQAADWACLILMNAILSQDLDNNERTRLEDALTNARTYGNKAHADLERHSLECYRLLYGIID